MSHKKIKTEPCLSPESPFMRKPSKEFLKRITFNRTKDRQSNKNIPKLSEYFEQQNIPKISFIPTNSSGNLQTQKNQSSKLKKTTIQLGTFKIKHENMILKTQLLQMQKKNSELIQLNNRLKEQNQELKKELEIYNQSKISKFSQETLQYTDGEDRKNSIKFIDFGSQQSLEIESYEILPTNSQISQVTSLVFDEEFKQFEDCNFLSSSINRKIKPSLSQLKLNKNDSSRKLQIEILSNRILYLQQQLQSSLIKERSLQSENESLRLCASMSKRKLEHKDSELKQIKIQQKKKKYFEKFFELSSEEDNQIN